MPEIKIKHHGRACTTCRRRGRGCDRRLPSCQTCEKSGVTCEGYPIRWSGIASRGKFAGKTVPVLSETTKTSETDPQERKSKRRRASRSEEESDSSLPEPPVTTAVEQPTDPPPRTPEKEKDQRQECESQPPLEYREDSLSELLGSIDHAIASNENLDNIDPQLTIDWALGWDETGEDDENDPESTVILNPFSPSLDVLNIPEELKFIINYYITEAAPKLCVDNLCLENPYSQFILPLAIEVRSLLYACAALASCQFNIRCSDSQPGNDFWKFKGKAMKRLQEDLYSESRAKHPGTIATVLMLCLCEICAGGVSNFDTHFQGAKRLIELRGKDRTPGNFVEQYLAWLDIMAAASHHRKPVFDWPHVAGLIDSASFQWSFDVFPCPIDQFQSVCQIVDLYKSQFDSDRSRGDILIEVQVIKQTLLSRPIHSERDQYWLHLTEAYRFSILLYLLRLFHMESDEDEIEWLICSVFYHAKSTPPASGWSDQLLWPLFHAGLEITDVRRQTWLRERMKCMQFSGGFGNVQSALQVLEGVWAEGRPVNYLELMAGDGSGAMLLI